GHGDLRRGDDPPPPGAAHRGGGPGPDPRGPAAVAADDRAREPRVGRVRPGAARAEAGDPRLGPLPVPAPGRAADPAGRHPFGRRTADAGDRPRVDEPAAPPDAGRAVAGAGADPRPRG